MIVGMNRRVAPKRRAGELAASVGDHFVDVHVELGAAARHPDMQGKHVVMLAGEDFVAGLHDQFVALIVKPFAVVVGDGGGLLQGRVGGDHLARNQILADAEVFERALGLSAPQLVCRLPRQRRGCRFLFSCWSCQFSKGLLGISLSAKTPSSGPRCVACPVRPLIWCRKRAAIPPRLLFFRPFLRISTSPR